MDRIPGGLQFGWEKGRISPCTFMYLGCTRSEKTTSHNEKVKIDKKRSHNEKVRIQKVRSHNEKVRTLQLEVLQYSKEEHGRRKKVFRETLPSPTGPDRQKMLSVSTDHIVNICIRMQHQSDHSGLFQLYDWFTSFRFNSIHSCTAQNWPCFTDSDGYSQ